MDGRRPAVERVASLPPGHQLTNHEWRVLMVLACDSFDGETTAPGLDNMARWAGISRSSAYAAIRLLRDGTETHPPLIAPSWADGKAHGGRTATRYTLLLPDAPTVQTVRRVRTLNSPTTLQTVRTLPFPLKTPFPPRRCPRRAADIHTNQTPVQRSRHSSGSGIFRSTSTSSYAPPTSWATVIRGSDTATTSSPRPNRASTERATLLRS